MNARRTITTILSMLCVAAVSGARPAQAEVHAAPAFSDVRTSVLDWIAGLQVADERVLEEIGTLWTEPEQPPSANDLLEAVVRSFSLADPDTGRFVRQCRLLNAPLKPPELLLMEGSRAASFYSANVSLYYGRYLAQLRMYDEALEQLTKLEPSSVVDPASLLFYRAVCQHHLLQVEDGIASIDLLLSNTEDVPISYSSVAKLMKHELEAFQRESLDEAARLMSDVARRLDLGRGGPPVRKREDDIVATLDKIIERMEQQQSGGGGGGVGGNQNNPSEGASDSSVKGSTAPGEVDHKKRKEQGDWGLLDPKTQARARQLIQYDFPPHYRRAVEKYFRKLAAQKDGRGG